MLALTRNPWQAIILTAPCLSGRIRIMVRQGVGATVRVGIDAPPEVIIVREEMLRP
ncbi:MAG TPA: carbon storage regulator [Candidatus Omnitrophica bacterium]|nr:carbon storage regulator [Candidatus Omnitrophota bacterium]